ncbi:MAG: hypothetical protein RBS07_14550 [Lentimicrobium sp.]|jgi:hypothetical protein|nr:hypothetical protein [Lentimicrobium sp.]
MARASFIVLLFIFCNIASAQENDDLFSRLQAISNSGVKFYNVDGIEISSQEKDHAFTAKNISRGFPQLKIRFKELVNSDSLLDFKNYYVFKSIEGPEDIFNSITYYFIETIDQKIIAFTFTPSNEENKDFEREFVRLVRDNAIPGDVFNHPEPDTINFAGRKIPLGKQCHWMGVNNVQCSSAGQMNWSVHKDSTSASNTVESHFESIQARQNGKVVSDTKVKVMFEGTETTARKIIYDFTGITAAMVAMTGGRNLTIYFVAVPVRQHYVSCVMSYWNNDYLTENGLAPLLDQVMKLK